MLDLCLTTWYLFKKKSRYLNNLKKMLSEVQRDNVETIQENDTAIQSPSA